MIGGCVDRQVHPPPPTPPTPNPTQPNPPTLPYLDDKGQKLLRGHAHEEEQADLPPCRHGLGELDEEEEEDGGEENGAEEDEGEEGGHDCLVPRRGGLGECMGRCDAKRGDSFSSPLLSALPVSILLGVGG